MFIIHTSATSERELIHQNFQKKILRSLATQDFISPVTASSLYFYLQYGPALSPHARAFVHHIIVYSCPTPLPEEAIGLSMPCDDFSAAESCRSGGSIGGWAVGGEVGISCMGQGNW